MLTKITMASMPGPIVNTSCIPAIVKKAFLTYRLACHRFFFIVRLFIPHQAERTDSHHWCRTAYYYTPFTPGFYIRTCI